MLVFRFLVDETKTCLNPLVPSFYPAEFKINVSDGGRKSSWSSNYIETLSVSLANCNKKHCVDDRMRPTFAMEDAGALPIEVDVQNMHMGDVIDIYPYEGNRVLKRNGVQGRILKIDFVPWFAGHK